MGSALAGPADLIREAVRHRKVLGGGMRQAGILAAAALHALNASRRSAGRRPRNARRLADGIRQIGGLRLDSEAIDTNIVIFHVQPQRGTAENLVRRLREQGVLVVASGPLTIRAVTHLDVAAADVNRALEILASAAAEPC